MSVMPMDKVFIKNLEIEAIIGIYDFERTTKQKVVFDIEMWWDVAKAAKSENIDDALNYKTLSDQLIEFVGKSEYQLIETLAEDVAAIIINQYKVETVKLKLHKPDALDGATDVGVEILRHRTAPKPRAGFMV